MSRTYEAEAQNYLRPPARVKWLSKYDERRQFRGTVVRVIGDRAIVRGDDDHKELVIPTYRLHAAK